MGVSRLRGSICRYCKQVRLSRNLAIVALLYSRTARFLFLSTHHRNHSRKRSHDFSQNPKRCVKALLTSHATLSKRFSGIATPSLLQVINPLNATSYAKCVTNVELFASGAKDYVDPAAFFCVYKKRIAKERLVHTEFASSPFSVYNVYLAVRSNLASVRATIKPMIERVHATLDAAGLPRADGELLASRLSRAKRATLASATAARKLKLLDGLSERVVGDIVKAHHAESLRKKRKAASDTVVTRTVQFAHVHNTSQRASAALIASAQRIATGEPAGRVHVQSTERAWRRAFDAAQMTRLRAVLSHRSLRYLCLAMDGGKTKNGTNRKFNAVIISFVQRVMNGAWTIPLAAPSARRTATQRAREMSASKPPKPTPVFAYYVKNIFVVVGPFSFGTIRTNAAAAWRALTPLAQGAIKAQCAAYNAATLQAFQAEESARAAAKQALDAVVALKPVLDTGFDQFGIANFGAWLVANPEGTLDEFARAASAAFSALAPAARQQVNASVDQEWDTYHRAGDLLVMRSPPNPAAPVGIMMLGADGTWGCSVVETNRLRVALGMQPLIIPVTSPFYAGAAPPLAPRNPNVRRGNDFRRVPVPLPPPHVVLQVGDIVVDDKGARHRVIRIVDPLTVEVLVLTAAQAAAVGTQYHQYNESFTFVSGANDVARIAHAEAAATMGCRCGCHSTRERCSCMFDTSGYAGQRSRGGAGASGGGGLAQPSSPPAPWS